jgi:hypothetical protein
MLFASWAAAQNTRDDGPAVLVRGLRTQSRNVSSYPFHFVAVGDDVYFTASPEAFPRRELWRTDGTP